MFYLHQFSSDRLDVVIQEVRLQVVHTELQCAQALADKSLGTVECGHQWVHKHGQVGQKRAEAHRDSETQLHKQILHVLLMEATLKHVQT